MSTYPQGYPNPYNWKMILVSQVLMILMSFVLSLYPQYFLPVYILYIIVILGITSVMTMRSNPLLSERKYLTDISNSRTLFEEKKAGELAQKDEEYMKKMQEFAMASFKSFMYMIIYIIAIFAFYGEVLLKIVGSVSGYERLLVYVIYFEALFLFNMFVYRRLIKFQTMEVMVPQSYKITEKGILSTDKSGVFLHSRHLVNAEIKENREKRYIEIHSQTSKLPYRIRLYTTEIDRLLEVLDRVKKLELKRQQSSSA
ncbi:DUF2208 domain-containing protein [Sulfurisphaera ohwakuensis]|uniref:DUF2208 domain-containing protein n=1 Tax=Sulfurisphaera ohwakuensis TaxID=69656 RepID=A0A650CE63_SULOH|nr:DUF2208 domain-containing protein [Sulfurisphaera ohwakuensis]MBB5253040.1 putative membrane protein [Sulfurisphaera ohwakuensis]QGR16036.1 DUF2208 domain-containing protein [Sulfurisphaera ohwakuensis]